VRFGIIGLGRMGRSLALHAREKGHEVVGYSRSIADPEELKEKGVELVDSLNTLVEALPQVRVIFLYIPHGPPTGQVCRDLQSLLSPEDVVVDGGNSHWKDSQARCGTFAEKAVRFLDMGTSGGIEGARSGACFMVGGDREAFDVVRPILQDLAIDSHAVLFVGTSGSGHFVKLVHNAIEFGMIQSIAEGVELLRRSEFELNPSSLFENWQHGSVIRGWLVELMGKALRESSDFGRLSTYVEDTGEVKWVLEWAMQQDIPTPVVSASQTALMQDRDLESPAAKAVALLRNQFGGHPLHLLNDEPGSRTRSS
jgi:6-phosphogluconate dehydrogenase